MEPFHMSFVSELFLMHMLCFRCVGLLLVESLGGDEVRTEFGSAFIDADGVADDFG